MYWNYLSNKTYIYLTMLKLTKKYSKSSIIQIFYNLHQLIGLRMVVSISQLVNADITDPSRRTRCWRIRQDQTSPRLNRVLSNTLFAADLCEIYCYWGDVENSVDKKQIFQELGNFWQWSNGLPREFLNRITKIIQVILDLGWPKCEWSLKITVFHYITMVLCPVGKLKTFF